MYTLSLLLNHCYQGVFVTCFLSVYFHHFTLIQNDLSVSLQQSRESTESL